MNARTVTVAVGTSVLLDGNAARIVEFDGRKVVVEHADGRYGSIALAEFVSEQAVWNRPTTARIRASCWPG